MISQLLNEMYHLNIQLNIKDEKISLIYEDGVLTNDLKQKIKFNKKYLMKRLVENEIAIKKGFQIYNHGDLYEYRYGLGAFIYIERDLEGKSSAWIANYAKNENKPYKVTMISSNTTFDAAFNKAAGFIDWLNKKNGRRVG
ncbi:TubC N-terminal docking domain-related protein [Litchfieldia salsa]|uniref:TubC N-terminal docking domain-containing protein n=1 Tax=Litchfieldia salsa TaxID=930152 RepID=A0A1H0VPY5_9BACI|nr:hypothetical protein [Litchfieldia salsa]SDP80245.1 hypothetical protein SAMN05216565_107118 [Litchfieldia salsa]